MSQASKKDHLSFIITFVIGVIVLLIFFAVLSNSKKENNIDVIDNSQCCECIKE